MNSSIFGLIVFWAALPGVFSILLATARPRTQGDGICAAAGIGYLSVLAVLAALA